MNDFTGLEAFGRPELEHDMDFLNLDDSIDGSNIDKNYNDIVSGFLKTKLQGNLLHQSETCSWEKLKEVQDQNIESKHRCVGLVIETRPDEITPEELLRIRRLGATKVQIGIQSLSDRILDLNQRGHTVATTRTAIRLLREGGFKIHAHWMPNLYGAEVSTDCEDFVHLFADKDFRPDELKIYPCSLIETAELMRKYEDGSWHPYSHDDLVQIMEAVLPQVPEYCRVTRVIRDIPSHDIVVGNKLSNFRELATKQIREKNIALKDIRSREIGSGKFKADDLQCTSMVYETSTGPEHFLQFVTSDNKIVAFLRLSLPASSFIEEIKDSAMIRELHVYGPVVHFGKSDQDKAQHLGLGTQLINKAVKIASAEGYKNLAVISAIGTQAYYQKQGFTQGPLYMHRSI